MGASIAAWWTGLGTAGQVGAVAGGLSTAATVYSATQQPKTPALPPQVNTQADTAAVSSNRARDQRRSLMGGGLASTILSQTGTPGSTGKTLLGS